MCPSSASGATQQQQQQKHYKPRRLPQYSMDASAADQLLDQYLKANRLAAAAAAAASANSSSVQMDASTGGHLIRTGSPNIICTQLPSHWRSNKTLPSTFKVIVLGGAEVKDGTVVEIKAGNEENCCGEIRNGKALTKNGIAKFHDLRFVGRSGRGKCGCG